MPVEYVIVNERHLVITTAWDVVTVAEATAHQERLKHDPDFSPEFHQLLDGTGITVLHITTEEAKLLARNSPPFLLPHDGLGLRLALSCSGWEG
jgi:hypothetical protein